MPKDTLTITDNRTGKSYELPVSDGTIRAMDLRQIKTGDDDFGLMTYDPAFMNTAACRSAITFIDGDKGILRYRGYPIEQLADRATFLEVAYLVCEGELPNKDQLDKWTEQITYHTYVHTNITKFLEGFRYDAHPMGDAARRGGRAVDVLSRRQGHPRSGQSLSPATPASRQGAHDCGLRLSALARPALRIPRQQSGLHRQFREHDVQHRRAPPAQQGAAAGPRDPPHPARRPRAELLDHRGPHRRLIARRSILRHLHRHRRPVRPAPRRGQRSGAADARRDRRQEEHSQVHRRGEGGARTSDGIRPPGVQVVRSPRQAHQARGRRSVRARRGSIRSSTSRSSWSESRWKTSTSSSGSSIRTWTSTRVSSTRRWDIPTEFFTVLFALGRMPGWLAQWEEMLLDKEQKIARPRQIFTGHDERPFVPIEKR